MTFHDLTLLNVASDTPFIRGLYDVCGCETDGTYFCHRFLDSIFEVAHAD